MLLDIYHKLYYLDSVPWIFKKKNNLKVFAVLVHCTYCTCTLISFAISFFKFDNSLQESKVVD